MQDTCSPSKMPLTAKHVFCEFLPLHAFTFKCMNLYSLLPVCLVVLRAPHPPSTAFYTEGTWPPHPWGCPSNLRGRL